MANFLANFFISRPRIQQAAALAPLTILDFYSTSGSQNIYLVVELVSVFFYFLFSCFASHPKVCGAESMLQSVNSLARLPRSDWFPFNGLSLFLLLPIFQKSLQYPLLLLSNLRTRYFCRLVLFLLPQCLVNIHHHT